MMTRRDYKILDEINFDILEDDKMRKRKLGVFYHLNIPTTKKEKKRV